MDQICLDYFALIDDTNFDGKEVKDGGMYNMWYKLIHRSKGGRGK